MLELGLPGLALWLAFIFWVLTRPLPLISDPWYLGKWLARVALAFSFMYSALTGIGAVANVHTIHRFYTVICGMDRDTVRYRGSHANRRPSCIRRPRPPPIRRSGPHAECDCPRSNSRRRCA